MRSRLLFGRRYVEVANLGGGVAPIRWTVPFPSTLTGVAPPVVPSPGLQKDGKQPHHRSPRTLTGVAARRCAKTLISAPRTLTGVAARRCAKTLTWWHSAVATLRRRKSVCGQSSTGPPQSLREQVATARVAAALDAIEEARCLLAEAAEALSPSSATRMAGSEQCRCRMKRNGFGGRLLHGVRTLQ